MMTPDQYFLCGIMLGIGLASLGWAIFICFDERL